MKLEFCRQIAEKSSYQVSSKSVEWEPSCFMRIDGQAGGMDGRKDGHDEADSRFSQFCDRA